MAEEEKYTAVDVPIQYGQAIQTPEGNIIANEQILVEILNKLDLIEKALNILVKG